MNYNRFKDIMFVVVSNYGDKCDVVLAKGLEKALKCFLKQQQILTSLLPDSELVIITGQDDDLSMPLMSVFQDTHLLLSLQSVLYCDGKSVSNGQLKPTPKLQLIDDCDSLVEVAYRLNIIYNFNSDKERKDKRRKNALKSWPSRHLTADYVTSEVVEFEEQIRNLKADFNVEPLSNEIDSIQLSYSTNLTV
jgi:hypothetical protein